MTFLLDVVSNVVANAAFWLLLGATFWLVSRFSQARFNRFFGTSSTGRVVVVLSNLWKAAESRRPVGYTISLHESLAGQRINALLAAAPLRLPEAVRGLVDALWLRSRTECVLEVSPPTGGDLDVSGTLIVIGGSGRNSVRGRHLEQGLPRAALVYESPDGAEVRPSDNREVIVRRSSGDIQRIRSQQGVAIIEKVILPEHHRTVFYCAGARSDSTWIATEYLVRHWRRLDREFGEDPFVICLAVPLPDIYSADYHEPTVLATIRP